MPDDNRNQIATLERTLADLPPDSPARPGIAQMLAQLRAVQPSHGQTGSVNLAAAQIDTIDQIAGEDMVGGDKVLGDKIVQQFFAGQPGEDGERLLRSYLVELVETQRDLRLGRMTRSKSGSGESLLPALELDDVFTALFTDGPEVRLHERVRPKTRAEALAQRLARRDRSADVVPPEQVRDLRIAPADGRHAVAGEVFAAAAGRGGAASLEALPDDAPVQLALARPELVSEALAQVPRLVLLGAPGSGKSTVLRYISLQLARHHLDPDGVSVPSGWTHAPIPIFCPLGLVASALSHVDPDQSDVAVFWKTVAAQLGDDTIRPGLARHLLPALRNGAALVLLDGLDEISATPDASGMSLRLRVSQAVQQAMRQLPRRAAVVLTCRIVPYHQPVSPVQAGAATPPEDWRLSPDDGWQVRTLQPFAFGQVQRFVVRWYRAACAGATAKYAAAVGAQRAEGLLAQLAANERLRRLVESPLLLTMLAILHYNRDDGDLPRDRARLYDECVQLLLERWEPRRTPEHQVPGLLERLEIAHLAKTEDLRAVLHQVALDAHNRPPDPGDGRGLLRGSEIEGKLSKFLRRLGCDRIERQIAAFEQALRDEVGLLQELGDDVYSFPHLTFQEYLAGCALADSPRLVTEAYAHWSSADGDRWREVLLLMVGRLRQQSKFEAMGITWLRALYNSSLPRSSHDDPGADGAPAPKSALQRQRDALLAADSYQEWDGRAALTSYEDADVQMLEQRLTTALLPIVAPPSLLTTDERVRAGVRLGALGDPRPGVTTLEPDWCDVPAGPFLLGSSAADADACDNEKPQRTVDLPGFRISRYPVTNAQWRCFIEDGGYSEQRWWSAAGWTFLQPGGHGKPWSYADNTQAIVQPAWWDTPRFNSANQPVVGISWYEATAFCRWLSAKIGYAVRLPSEAEWEKAARGSDGRIYPWGNNWDSDRANIGAKGFDQTTGVGCYPEGASPCGALDMSGNVWEWTATPWQDSYHKHDGTRRKRDDGAAFVFRGGAWGLSQRVARCASRGNFLPSDRYNNLGVRVVAALTPPA